jgi:exodeoxyribonuclease VII large subunit
MSLPFAPSAEPVLTNAPEFTVSELSRAVKRTIEDGFEKVRVRGEIGGFRGRHSSGHCYFTLKDAEACMDAVVWRSAYGRLAVKPEEGLEVVATGRLTTFPKKSSYQITIEEMEIAGAGALMKLLEERRKALAAEGLFDESRKRPLPVLPRVIGVVTSPTGSVIRDILHRVADRFPSHVVVWPVRVQGETSGAEVAAAVRGFATWNGPRPDVIIVARGGGSIEDLWGFNDEAVVRAVAASPIPIVSAVGHETDWTLIDHAADRRAPTPTGAAEMVVPVRAECLATLSDRARRHETAIATVLQRRRADLRLLSRALPAPADVLAARRQRLDMATDRLAAALFRTTANARRRHLSTAGRLTPRLPAALVAGKAHAAAALGERLGGAMARSTSAARARYLGTAARLTPRVAERPVERARDGLAHTLRRLQRAADGRLGDARAASARSGARLSPHLLHRTLTDGDAALARLVLRRERAWGVLYGAASGRLGAAGKLLSAVSYQAVLARGFALVRRLDDSPVHAAADVGRGEALDLQFADGRVRVVEGSRPARRPKPLPAEQGTLFDL